MSKVLKRVLVTLGVLSIVTLAFLWYIGVIGHNFRVVSAGKVYRSKQLSYENVSSHIAEEKIKSILELNSGNIGDEFYRNEIRACKDCRVKHYDVFMSAHELPRPDELIRIFAVFDSAEYPILLHCVAGADRSGLVGVLYQIVYENKSLEDAENDQLTWRFGHFSFGQAAAMDEFYDLYRKNANGKSLRKWIEEDYPKVYAEQRK